MINKTPSDVLSDIWEFIILVLPFFLMVVFVCGFGTVVYMMFKYPTSNGDRIYCAEGQTLVYKRVGKSTHKLCAIGLEEPRVEKYQPSN